MSTINTIYDRHSVRQYHNQPLREEVIHVLRSEIDACNQESGLHIQSVSYTHLDVYKRQICNLLF